MDIMSLGARVDLNPPPSADHDVLFTDHTGVFIFYIYIYTFYTTTWLVVESEGVD